MSNRVVAVAIVALVLVGPLALSAATGAQQSPTLQTPSGFDETTFQVTIYGNGSATWTIEHRRPLTNDSQREQFESFAETFETSETPLYVDFIERAGLLTQFGSNRTDRTMRAEQFGRSASVDPVRRTGAVSMSFLWTNFTAGDGNRVVMSDVFEGGFYIGPNQSFVVERGPQLAFVDARPTPDSTSSPDSLTRSATVTWNGEQSFNDQRPYVELAPRSAVDDRITSAAPDDTSERGSAAGTPTDSTPAAGGGGGATMMLAIALVLLALGGVAAYRYGALGSTTDGDEPGPTGTAQQVSAEPDDGGSEAALADEELLTDSDRVIQLLEENGGRMKQVDIVDSTDWSKSKVSMLLSDMENDDEISKLRVGRENIISIAGEEPDAAGSPFDEE